MHKLFLMERRLVDGGVVVYEYQAFCGCAWSMQFASRDKKRALAAYTKHADCQQCFAICTCWTDLRV